MADDKGKDEEGWEPIEAHEFPDAHDFDQDPVLTGIVLWRENVPTTGLDGKPRTSTFYCLVDPDGVERGFWGTALLDKLMASVEDHDTIKVTYEGKDELSKGRTMRRFSVLRATG